MLSLDYNALPRATRERFVRALAAPPPEGPLASRTSPPPPMPALAFVVAVALAALGIVGLTVVGFGRIATPAQGRGFLAGYVVLAGVFGASIAMAVRRRREARLLPFVPGVYVLAQDVVDARTSVLGLYPLNELTSVDVVHEGVGGVYRTSILWAVFPTQSFTFEVRGRHAGDTCRQAVLEARRKVTQAYERGERSDLAAYDPFADVRALGFPVYHEAGGPVARALPIWASFVWAIGLVSAFVLGVAVWRGRNAASAWRASVAHERAEVLRKRTLRAHLADALQTPAAGRAEALDKLLRENPGSEIDAEARDALAAAIHADFAAAKTARELRAELARWPAAPDVPAARTELHALYQAALSDLRLRGTGERNIVPVMDAVFAWQEAHAEPVPVRFRRRVTQGLATTDRLLDAGLFEGDAPAAGGGVSAAAFFAEGRLAAREAVIVRGLEQAFREVFPGELLLLAPGPPVLDAAAEVSQPSLVVDYDVVWNGLTYLSVGGRRFLGLQVRSELTFVVPPARSFSFSLRAETPPSVAVADASADERVYDAILARTIEASAPRLVAVFFDVRTRAASGR